MIRLFSHYIPLSTLVLAGLDTMWILCVFLFGYTLVFTSATSAMPAVDAGALLLALSMGSLLWIRFQFSRDAMPLINRRLMILGGGPDAVMVKETLEKVRVRGFEVIGFYVPDHVPLASLDQGIPIDRVLPRAGSVAEVARRYGVNEIVITARDRRNGALPLADLLTCRLHGIKVIDLSAFYEQYHSKVRLDLLRESWFIFGEGFRQHRGRMAVKRLFDIVASATLLVLALPVMIVAAILVKLESPGPVIYRQERTGLGGRPFNVYKFRSMRADAEKDGTPQWAQAGDPRVTRFGRFMRMTRIDELPQLFNVLAGQMSLVGPRPERPYFVEQLTRQVPFYAARNSLKPGVTGWAQVRHHYGASVDDASTKLEYDLYYVKNHTLLLDILILFYSVKVVLTGQGAR